MKKNLILSALLLASLTACSQNTSSSSLLSNDSTSTTSTSSSTPNNNIDVIILCGQSNAEGHTYSEYLLPAKKQQYLDGFEDVQINYNCNNNGNTSNGFTKVTIGQGVMRSRFGPEVGMAEYISAKQDELANPVRIVKFAVGGTKLRDRWFSPSSNSNGRSGDLFNKLIDFTYESCEEIISEGLTPNIKAVCWMQGESDANETDYTFYEDLEEAFVNDLNDYLVDYTTEERINFIDAGISDCSAWVKYLEINQAKQNNATKDPENHYYIDTIGEKLEYNKEPTTGPDLFHYDADSMIKLGSLFSQTLFDNEIL